MSSLKFQSLKKNSDFERLYREAKRWHRESFIIFYKNSNKALIGYTASKKIGNAVKRNFSKRRLKALVNEYKNVMKKGEYIFVAKKKIQTENFEVLKREFLFSLKRVNALKK